MPNQKIPTKLKLENLLKKKFVEYRVPTNRRLGIKVTYISTDSKSFILKLPYKRKNTNVGGTVHGSAIMCLAETIHGVAVLWSFDPKQHRMVN
jgi:acyl-coenzyme A thioesterase PaaI-like protein